MRVLGGLLICLGGVGVFASLNMETSVMVGGDLISNGSFRTYITPVSRVENIGLLEQRQNYIVLSSVAIVVGVLLYGFGTLAHNQANSIQQDATIQRCPECNAVIEGELSLAICDKCAAKAHAASLRAEMQRLYDSRNAATSLEDRKQTQEKLVSTAFVNAGRLLIALSKNFLPATVWSFKKFNSLLIATLGPDNVIILRFVQFGLYIAVPLLTAVIIGLILGKLAK